MRTSDSRLRKRSSKSDRSGRIRFARDNPPKAPKKKPRPVKDVDSEPSLVGQLAFLGLKGLGRLVKVALIAAATLAAIGLIVVLLLAGYLYVSKSTYFTIKSINISGIEQTRGEEIKEAAGLDQDVNIWTFKADEAEAAIGTLPWLSEVRVIKKWPDTVLIDVKEHKPRVLATVLGRLHYMNDKGVAFRELAPGENPSLPIVSGFSEDDLLTLGPRVRSALKEVFWLVDALGARNDEFRLDNISEINYDMVRGLTLFTKSGGLEVKIGFGQYEEKFRRLGRVLAHLKMQGKYEGLVYINLEASPRVIVRYEK